MEQVRKYIYEQVAAQKLSQQEAKLMLKELQIKDKKADGDIAVIGMSGKFPNASNIDEYWENIYNGVNCIGDFPAERKKDFNAILSNPSFAEIFLGARLPEDVDYDTLYGKGGFLKEIDKFDAAFFRIPPKEAKFMSPLQRLFLETAWEAVEDAGYGGNKIYGTRTGVFVGNDHTALALYKYITEKDQLHETGSWAGILASRIAYIFNLQGPSMVIDTACSSGLVAIHTACSSIRNQECDLAIAGGIHIMYTALKIDGKEDDVNLKSVKSQDDIVRTFDKNANGTVWSEGVGALLLKPLNKAIADGDSIYAVIKGSAINNDGASNGITAPSPEAQEDVIIRAWKDAKINPETISYIEAHGTGTVLGDPIEIKGMTNAFRKFTDKKQFCGIGSVKTSIGHLVGAAGIASAFKVILALKNKVLPASINFSEPNPYIGFCDSPVYVNDKLRSWNNNGQPRRAGVSSFGFSGTNCHVVFEEAPEIQKNADIEQENTELLTISAKSEKVLLDYLHRYKEFISSNAEHSLKDICYTANTGRGHFSNRLVLMVKNYRDLKNKIDIILNNGLKDIKDNEMFYGEFKMVSDNKVLKVSGEITEREKRELSKAANIKLTALISNLNEDNQYLKDLCELYTQGADIEWDRLYDIQKRRKVHIPVYPLERIRYWAAPKIIGSDNKAIAVINEKTIKHPLLDRCICDTFNQGVFIIEFNVNKHWVLKEHIILGNYVVPGTAYIEIAREACKKYYNNSSIEFRDIVFMSPIVVGEQEIKEVQVIIQKEKDHLGFVFSSKSEDSNNPEDINWITHAEGKAYKNDFKEIPQYNMNDIRARCNEEIERPENNGSNQTVVFGPRWDNMERTFVGVDQAYISLRLSDEYVKDMDECELHAALLDNGVNGVIQGLGKGLYLPLSYKSMKIFSKMPDHFYSYIRKNLKNSDNEETISLDVSLMDENGNAFVDIKDYTIKRVNNAVSKFRKLSGRDNYYTIGYVETDKPERINADPTDGILVFNDNKLASEKIIEELKQVYNDVIEVELGNNYARIDCNKYTISNNQADYYKLIEDIKDRNVVQIIHMPAVIENEKLIDQAELIDIQTRGIYSLFYITKAIMANKINKKLKLAVIANCTYEVSGGEKTLNPHNAALFGFTKVIRQENEGISCKFIDTDEITSISDLMEEIKSNQQLSYVAYREQTRFIEEFSEISIENAEQRTIDIKDTGVYVITGGTGGLGLEVSKYLTSRNNVNLALVARSNIPEQGQWDIILEEQKNKKLCRLIKAIRDMEKSGSKVEVYSADISDYQASKTVFDCIKQKHSSINGLIHCAGLAGDGFIINKDEKVFMDVIRPKILGAWNIDKLTENENLDFFIMFSSIASLFGTAGQGDYTAANSYLDAFASYRRKNNRTAIAINWPAWKETGMAVDYGVNDDSTSLFRSISTGKALGVIEDVINSDLSRVVPIDLNYSVVAPIVEQLPIKLSDSVKLDIEKNKGNIYANNNEAGRDNNARNVVIKGSHEGEYSKTEKVMANIWAEILDLGEIDIYDNFNAMGGDSILATQLLKAIDKQFPNIVDISDIFSYPSVNQLAAYIDSKNSNGEITEQAEENAKEELTDDELMKLLDEIESGEGSVEGSLEILTGRRAD